VRQTGSGPASGNGNSSNPADNTAAAHNIHCFPALGGIQAKVYRIRLVAA
jgi:hypothetical protein